MNVYLFLFLFPVFKETSVRWPVTQGLITMATEGLVSPVIGPVPPAQVGSHEIFNEQTSVNT